MYFIWPSYYKNTLYKTKNIQYKQYKIIIPFLFQKCHDSKFGKLEMESKYRRTFARTQPSTSKVSKSIMSILQYYEWKRYVISVDYAHFIYWYYCTVYFMFDLYLKDVTRSFLTHLIWNNIIPKEALSLVTLTIFSCQHPRAKGDEMLNISTAMPAT